MWTWLPAGSVMTMSEESLLRALRAGDPKPTPRLRMRRLNEEIRAARMREQRLAERYGRTLAGRGEWADWSALFGKNAEDTVLLATSSLVVRQARRHGQVPPGPRTMPQPLDQVLEALSFEPREDGLPDLHDTVLRWERRITAPNIPPADRFGAAVALMALGPDDGAQRRDELWTSGLVHDRSAGFCDRQIYVNACLFDWSVFDNLMRVHGTIIGPVGEDDDETMQPCYSFDSLADMINMGLWDGYVDRRQPQTNTDTAM